MVRWVDVSPAVRHRLLPLTRRESCHSGRKSWIYCLMLTRLLRYAKTRSSSRSETLSFFSMEVM